MVMGRTDGSAGEDLPPGSSGLWEVEGDSAALPCRESAMQTDTPPAAALGLHRGSSLQVAVVLKEMPMLLNQFVSPVFEEPMVITRAPSVLR